MDTSKVKALIIVSVLLFATGLIAVGCKPKAKQGWVNTSTLPGQGAKRYSSRVVAQSTSQPSNSSVIYLGQESRPSNSSFGPGEISFEFKDLR